MASAILAHGDAFNEPWQDRGHFCAGFRIVRRDVEVGHGGSVDIGRLWMQARDRRRYLRKQLLQ